MRNVALILAAVAASAGATGSAAAQVITPDQADARCLMVLQFIGRDPKQAAQAKRGVYYYLGRITARGAVSRVEAIIKTEAPKLTAQQAQDELKRCSSELNLRTKEYQAVNERLAATAKSPAVPPKK